MSYPEDRECIRRALAGDQAAFEAIYRAYRPQVQAAILRRTADRDVAEDLVQITFMRAFRGLSSFRGDAALSTWLTQIAMNVCLSHFRSGHVAALRQGMVLRGDHAGAPGPDGHGQNLAVPGAQAVEGRISKARPAADVTRDRISVRKAIS